MFYSIFQPLRPLVPHLSLKSFGPSEFEVLWITRFSWKKENILILNWALYHSPPPTSVHFYRLSKVLWVCCCLNSLWMCLPHISSAQYSITPSLCHFSVHLQAAPLLISSLPWARANFSGLGSLFSGLLSGPVLPFVLLQIMIHYWWRSHLLSHFYHFNQISVFVDQ